MIYETKYWASKNKDQCWCGKKAVGKFKHYKYCSSHLEQEQYLDEREFNGSREDVIADLNADYLNSVKL